MHQIMDTHSSASIFKNKISIEILGYEVNALLVKSQSVSAYELTI